MSFSFFLRQLVTNPALLITVLLTLGVICVNGITDAPNAIATCVSTRSLDVNLAIVMAAVCNCAGVVVMTMVNSTVAMTITHMVHFGEDTSIALVALCFVYFLGNKRQKRQVEQQELLEAAAQTATNLGIDKKKMKNTQAGLPKAVTYQTPKYMRWAKVPVVKAKIGPKVMTLIADGRVFDSLPVKTEAKVVISGIYITEIKSVRGGAIPTPPKKKGFFARFKRNKKDKK